MTNKPFSPPSLRLMQLSFGMAGRSAWQAGECGMSTVIYTAATEEEEGNSFTEKVANLCLPEIRE